MDGAEDGAGGGYIATTVHSTPPPLHGWLPFQTHLVFNLVRLSSTKSFHQVLLCSTLRREGRRATRMASTSSPSRNTEAISDSGWAPNEKNWRKIKREEREKRKVEEGWEEREVEEGWEKREGKEGEEREEER